MTLREKIQAWLKAKRLNQSEAAAPAGMAQSSMSQYLKGEFELTDAYKILGLTKRIQQDYPGASMDWLLDDALGWPPPDPDRREALSAAEAKVLRLVRDLFDDDPDLKEATDRIGLKGDYRPQRPSVVVTGPSRAEHEAEQKDRDAAQKKTPNRTNRPAS